MDAQDTQFARTTVAKCKRSKGKLTEEMTFTFLCHSKYILLETMIDC